MTCALLHSEAGSCGSIYQCGKPSGPVSTRSQSLLRSLLSNMSGSSVEMPSASDKPLTAKITRLLSRNPKGRCQSIEADRGTLLSAHYP